MSQDIKISVIICTYNRAAYLPDALQSLYTQQLDRNRFEVLVVDNNSTDDTAKVCRQFIQQHAQAQFHYLSETKQGASYARNTGAAAAKGEYLCFMDDDAIAEPDYLLRIVQFFEQYPGATGLGGRIIPRYIPEEPAWMSKYVSSMVGNFDYASHTTVFRDGKYPLESNMVVTKKAFDAIRGFNTALPGVSGTLRIGGEGKDFFYRLMNRGGLVYYDPAIIVHHVVETAKLTPEYLYRVASGYGRGERVRTKQQGRLAFWAKIIEYLFKLGAAIVLATGYALRGQSIKAMPLIRFRIDALKGLFDSTINTKP